MKLFWMLAVFSLLGACDAHIGVGAPYVPGMEHALGPVS